MKKLLGSIAILALAVPFAAHAADLPAAAPSYKAPVMAPAPAYYWSGCYFGGNAGGVWEKASNTFDNGAGLVEDFSFNKSSWIAGGQVGCQYQWTNVVFGVEGTWSGMDLNQTDTSVFDPNRTRTLKLDEIATVVGKLGFAWDRAMFYAVGGWADGRFNWFAINNATGVNGGFQNWQSGWTVGGGIDYMVMPSLVVGVKFDYYNFKFDHNNILATDGSLGNVFNSNANVYAVTARASWLFNWGGPVVARY
jgi:outer membrane immunogenic protein